MKKYSLLLIVITFFWCCKTEKDTSNFLIVKKLFSKLMSKVATSNDSLGLLEKYNFNISIKNDPIRLSFEQCIPFEDQNIFDDNFNLQDITEWYEEALVHKHIFYVKNNYVIVMNLLKINTLKECEVNYTESFMIDAIRIYERDDYIVKSKKSFSPYFSKKIDE